MWRWDCLNPLHIEAAAVASVVVVVVFVKQKQNKFKRKVSTRFCFENKNEISKMKTEVSEKKVRKSDCIKKIDCERLFF